MLFRNWETMEFQQQYMEVKTLETNKLQEILAQRNYNVQRAKECQLTQQIVQQNLVNQEKITQEQVLQHEEIRNKSVESVMNEEQLEEIQHILSHQQAQSVIHDETKQLIFAKVYVKNFPTY